MVNQVHVDTHYWIHILQNDHGGEYTWKLFKDFFKELIQHKMTTLYILKQNEKAKPNNQTIMECVQSMLHHKNMLLNFWAKVTHSAITSLIK
jgi:hypothetical protein